MSRNKKLMVVMLTYCMYDNNVLWEIMETNLSFSNIELESFAIQFWLF